MPYTIKPCAFCGTIKRMRTRADRPTAGKYCSLKCQALGRVGSKAPWAKPPHKTGEKSSNWRGGRRKTYNGYIACWVKEHPYKNVSGTVYEHRLVMEKKIKRYLLPEEVVHHINGIKDDNRMENLILFKNTNEHSKWHGQKKNKNKQ